MVPLRAQSYYDPITKTEEEEELSNHVFSNQGSLIYFHLFCIEEGNPWWGLLYINRGHLYQYSLMLIENLKM